MNSKFNPHTKIWSGIDIALPFSEGVFINELVLASLKKTPERIHQICDDDGISMKCEELRVKIIRFAQNLTSAGIKDEDVVGLICENSLNLTAFTHGVIQLGAIVNPMAVNHSPADLVNMWSQTKPKLVICDAKVVDKVRSVLMELESSACIYTTVEKIEGVPFADDFLEPTGRELEYEPQRFNDPNSKTLAIMTSSGSTGPAKGVCMQQKWFLKFFSLAPTEESRSLSFSPIIWGSSFSGIILTTLTNETRIGELDNLYKTWKIIINFCYSDQKTIFS